MRTLTLLLFMFPLAMMAQDGTEIVKINSLTQHLGSISKGSLVDGVFEFVNISKEDIQIDFVSTCDCTTATWTRGKITPGEKGEIRYTFDSSSKENEETLDIDVYFKNKNPKKGNPYSLFLSYTYTWAN